MDFDLLHQALQKPTDRRSFLRQSVAGLATAGLLLSPLGQLAEAALPERQLSLYNTHTGEEVHNLTYWANGHYLPEALNELNYLLRDHRADAAHKIDPKLFDLLVATRRQLPGRDPFHIVSGYRCPETNNSLRQKSSGVAKFSLHMSGKAVDIRLPDVPLKDLRLAGAKLGCGGVGYYPKSDFVHLDTGKARTW